MLSPALGHYGRLTTSHSCALAAPFNFKVLTADLYQRFSFNLQLSTFDHSRLCVLCASVANSAVSFCEFLPPFIFISLRIAFPASPLFSHLSEIPPGVHPYFNSKG